MEESVLSEKQIAERIKSIQNMIMEDKGQLQRKIKKICSQTFAQKKTVHNRKELEKRIHYFTTFTSHIIQQFYSMVSEGELIEITSEIDIIEKMDKFKKNVLDSAKKISINLDPAEEGCIQKNIFQKGEKLEDCKEQERERSRGKNSKICHQSAVQMNVWLLKNFSNPYPSIEEKMDMAKKGKLTLSQVSNWFINARERTIKKYQSKQSENF